MQGQPVSHFLEVVGKRLEITAPVLLPVIDHILDLGEIVRSG